MEEKAYMCVWILCVSRGEGGIEWIVGQVNTTSWEINEREQQSIYIYYLHFLFTRI